MDFRKTKRSGFTLVELLTVISIIGLLSTIATVSYDSVRAKSRDVKRLADLDTIRKALEFDVNVMGGYPADGTEGDGGLVLGGDGAHYLTDAGWKDGPEGEVFLTNVPKNPGPFGADYVYESLNTDGTPCDVGPCREYRVSFYLETQFVGQEPGAHITSPEGVNVAPPQVAANVEERAVKPAGVSAVNRLAPAINAVVETKRVVLDNPVVEKTAEVAAAPVGTAAVVAAAATAVPTAQYGFYLYLFLTQPALFLRRRRKQADWGVVYNAGSKLPVDLAIVRLIDTRSGRVTATKVTDTNGRFVFLPPAGSYRLEVVKPGFNFPSRSLAGSETDGSYDNLYFGAEFDATERMSVNPSVPVDTAEENIPDRTIVKNYLRGRIRNGFALSGFIVTAVSFAAKPGKYLGALLVLQLVMYFFLRLVAKKKKPGRWGMVVDESDGSPVARAVVRLFSLPYNKLVETQVTDRRGRYFFLVGKNKYYVTVTHPGYWKTESYALDLGNIQKPEVISAVLPVRSVELPPQEAEGEAEPEAENAEEQGNETPTT